MLDNGIRGEIDSLNLNEESLEHNDANVVSIGYNSSKTRDPGQFYVLYNSVYRLPELYISSSFTDGEKVHSLLA